MVSTGRLAAEPFSRLSNLLTVVPARTGEVVDRLRSISGAIVQEVLGPYDVIVELTSDTTVDITQMVRSQIRGIPGVESTVTCTFVDGLFGDGAGGE